MHKDQGAEGKKYLPSRNVLGVTEKKFKWPILRGQFNSHPLKESHERMSTLLNIRDM